MFNMKYVTFTALFACIGTASIFATEHFASAGVYADFKSMPQFDIPRKPLDKQFMNELFASAPMQIQTIKKRLCDPHYEGPKSGPLLFVGTPGTGKTTVAQALAEVSGRQYSFIRAPLLGNEYKDSTVQNLARYIVPLIKQNKPAVIVIDELMSVAAKEGSLNDPDKKALDSLWTLMDDFSKNEKILFIATANSTGICHLHSKIELHPILFGSPNLIGTNG